MAPANSTGWNSGKPVASVQSSFPAFEESFPTAAIQAEIHGRQVATAIERRKRQRFRINAPVAIIAGDQELSAYTRDLSESGIYFYTDGPVQHPPGSVFDFLVELPPEITVSGYCPIRCRARVVRTEACARNLSGVAAEMLEYAILKGAPPLA
jgi:hypothetical protein